MNDKYVFETESSREMEIMASRHKILSVLDDIKNWRRELYKGYENNVRILCNGKLYTYTEFEKARDELPKDELPKDEHVLIKDCKHVYLDNDLIDKIDDFLSEANYLLDY